MSDFEPKPPLAVYEASRGLRLPQLGPYARQAWRRRRFAFQLARSDLKAQHFDNVLGQLWVLVNPMLLAAAYYLLVAVIFEESDGGLDYLAALLGALFAFFFTRNVVMLGGRSIIGGAGLIVNAAFPRILLPVSALVSGFLTFLPMLTVYAGFHAAAGFPVGPELLLLIPLVALQGLFGLGVALALSASTVFFRDLASFLPFALRLWLYVSPVLYTTNDVPADIEPWISWNPLYSILGAWHEILVLGAVPWTFLAASTAWAGSTLIVGGLLFLVCERHFALRV